MSKTNLVGHWIHASEEDTESAMVFRPSGYPLPRARGRFSFQLRDDKTCTCSSIGSDDRSEESRGGWQFEEQTRVLRMTFPDGTEEHLSVASVEKDKLVVTKEN